MKKEWLNEEFEKGYAYRKGDTRHKFFIEYGQAEKS
jgi:hypothetical protein